MTQDDFWAIVEQSRTVLSRETRDGNFVRQQRELVQLLQRLTSQDQRGFKSIFSALLVLADRPDIYEVAAELGEGCGDDGFEYFRRWLISMGRTVFEEALVDARTIVAASEQPEVEATFFEDFGP